MGTVWRAWDERLKRRVAAKQIRAEAGVTHLRARLRREAQAAARLNHPAIVHIYDIVEEEAGDWIIMELVRGRTLRQWLDEKGPLDPGMAARLGGEIAEGLAEAHELGILHRDLKAVNVMVTPAGRAKILDFGLAKDLAKKATDQDLTFSTPGIVLGTAYAMSPEQALGRDLEAPSDLFSLGALLYEMMIGSPPFRGDSPTSSLARVLSYQPPPLRKVVPGLSPALSDLVEGLLEKEPADRPQSAREVARALAALAAGERGSLAQQPARPASLPHESTTLLTMEQGPVPRQAPRRASESGHRRTLGERRLLTVACCGLVEWAEDSGEAGFLDLEALSESMASFQELAREVSERHSGSLGTTLGHLLWLYFGYPHAHEDDVQRAVRAARELIARIDEIGPFSPGGKRRLAVRVAVHTGPAAVVSRPGSGEHLQLGSVLDLATSLQSLAPAGEILVSGASLKLIARDFTTESLPPVRVPGLGEPVAMHRILRETAPHDRVSGRETLLVGREREVAFLEDRFRLVCDGFGQAVMISGEAGIGKSRLVSALRERLAGTKATWWIAYGSPYTQSSPLAPIVDLLDRIVSHSSEMTPGDKIARLEELLQGSPFAESLPVLASLLSIGGEGRAGEARHPRLAQSPEAQRKNIFQTLLALAEKTAERQPLVLVVEDLHWVDPSTLELLTLLLEEISSLPLMLIATYRPEFQGPLGHWNQRTQLGLSRLTQDEAATLVSRLAGGREVPADVRQEIVARTDGIPLFVEELTNAVLETGRTQGKADIPSTLNGSLAARLDGLGAAKEVAQIASVIGRTFTFEILEAIAPFDAATLRKRLDELIQAGLIHRSELGHRSRFSFKHALVQDAAYASLLAKDRQELHLKIARRLEEKELEPASPAPAHPGAGDNDRMVLAHHWSQAVDVRQPEEESVRRAVFYRIAAGEHSLRMGAYKEAHAQLEAALRMVERLPPGSERDRQELVVRMRLGTVLAAIRGWGSPEVHEAWRRARELCLQLEDRRELAQVLFGLWASHYMHAEYEEAIKLAEEHLDAARELGPAERTMAHHALANSLLAVCRLPECLLHAEIAAALAEGVDEEVFLIEYGQDPRIIAASTSCWVLWQMGLQEEALARDEALSSVAAKLAHPFNLAVAASTSMWLHRQGHAAEATLACAERLIQVSKASGGFPEHETAAKIYRDWALAELGQADEVVDEALESLERYSRAGGQASMASFYAIGAEVCRRTGRLEDALGLIDKGLSASRNGGLLAEVELYCLQGEILDELASQADSPEAGAGAERRRQAEASLARAFDLASQRWQVAYLDRVIRGLSRFPGDRSREIQQAQRLREEVPHLVKTARDRVAEEMARAT